MRVLVTGASGTIGRAVCEALLARGDEVYGLSRSPEKAKQASPKVTWFGWNPSARAAARARRSKASTASSTSSASRSTSAGPTRRRSGSSNPATKATHNLVAAINAADPKPSVLVGQSAIGYYGDRGDAIVDEETAPGDSFDAKVVVAWEAASREVSDSVRLALMRTGLVLDKDSGLLGELMLPFKLGVGGPGRRRPQLHALDQPRRRGRDAALGARHPDGEAASTTPARRSRSRTRSSRRRSARRSGGRRSCRCPKLAVKVRLGAELGEVATGGQRATPKRALEEGYVFQHPDIESGMAAALA